MDCLAYLVVVDIDDDSGFPANLLNGVEVSESINFVQAAVDTDTRAGPSVPHGAVSVALKLTPPGLSPLLKEGILIVVTCSAPGVIIGLAVALRGGVGDGVKAEDASTGSANAVAPLVLAGSLIVAGVGDDALDASGTTVVEGGGGEVDLSGASAGESVESRHPHSCVDLVVAEGVFFRDV